MKNVAFIRFKGCSEPLRITYVNEEVCDDFVKNVQEGMVSSRPIFNVCNEGESRWCLDCSEVAYITKEEPINE